MAEKTQKEKRVSWVSLAMMSFVIVWVFQSLINGFYYFDGLAATVPWTIVMVLYFLPYALMVGELGSTFKDSTAGISSWLGGTVGPKLAFFVGWTYWVVQLPYLSQKPVNVMIGANWAIFQDTKISHLNPIIMQGCCLLIFFLAVFVAQRGISVLSMISSIAGTAIFVMSIMFVVMMVAAPAITDGQIDKIDWTFDNFLPKINSQFFTSISILLLAVGGCEMVAPYANSMRDKKRGFSKGMITVAMMVMICAVLGTVALGMVVGHEEIPGDFLTNGAYYAFRALGQYYFGSTMLFGFPLSNIFVIVYGAAYAVSQFAILMIVIDAPLRTLLRKENKEFLPKVLFKQNARGIYVNGYKLVVTIVSILIILPALGIGNVDEVVEWLIKLVSVCVPLCSLPVFISYIPMKKNKEKFPSEYQFVKNKKLGVFFGVWCFTLTIVACVMGMYSPNPFEFVMNIATPIVLLGLGVLLPMFTKRLRNKEIK